MDRLRILAVEAPVIWENVESNLKFYDSLLDDFFVQSSGYADIVVFPEFFAVGFTMNYGMAEDIDGDTVKWMRAGSKRYNCAMVGSIPVKTSEGVVNRAFFVTPEQDEYIYDKRHLFRMGDENEHYTAGKKRTIFNYRGWNISLNICYDLRFPVWSRNRDNEYDLMINVANWPESRIAVTEHLIKSRAIENLSYYLFVNRTGEDPGIRYNGGSRVVNYKGEDMGEHIDISGVNLLYAELSMENLREFRDKFPAYLDAEGYQLIIEN